MWSFFKRKKSSEIDFLSDKGFYPMGQFLDNDVFLVGFPKSGNTWMQSILAGLMYGIDTRYLPDRLVHEIVPDVSYKKFYKRLGSVNFFKSHLLPKKEYKRVIYIVRDGRDAMVSYFHMNKQLGSDLSIDEMIFESKGVFPCSWGEHVQSWIENPFNAEMLILKYEDLLMSPKEEVLKLLQFLKIERDAELIDRVIFGTSFLKMKEKEQLWGMENPDWTSEKVFFRKGQVGSYMEELTSSQIKHFNSVFYNQLKRFNYL